MKDALSNKEMTLVCMTVDTLLMVKDDAQRERCLKIAMSGITVEDRIIVPPPAPLVRWYIITIGRILKKAHATGIRPSEVCRDRKRLPRGVGRMFLTHTFAWSESNRRMMERHDQWCRCLICPRKPCPCTGPLCR